MEYENQYTTSAVTTSPWIMKPLEMYLPSPIYVGLGHMQRGAMGALVPLTRRKGPLNLRGRSKITFRMQEIRTSKASFFKISRGNIPQDPP